MENYIINFSLLSTNIIDYDEFLQRSLSEEVVIEEGIQEEDITINKDAKATPMKVYGMKQPKEGSRLKNEPSSKIGS